MHLITELLAAALFLLSRVSGRGLPEGTLIARAADLAGDYSITSKMMVRGVIDGHVVENNGTIQEFYARVAKEHPEFNVEAYLAQVQARDEFGLEERDKAGPPLCYPVNGQPWTPAPIPDIESGINYLNSLPGENIWCYVGAGPRNCVGVACAGQGAITWCNDNPYPLTVGCGTIANTATDLVYQCSAFGNVCGQEFDNGGWNVYITRINCPA